jgi:hypothetical protein
MNFNIKRYIIFLIGILVMTLGVSLTVKSEIGAGAYDSINFGLAKLLNINVSIAIWLTSFIIVVIASIIRRKFLKLTTFITAIIVGISTDMWVMIVKIISVNTIFERIIVFFTGICLVSTGVAIYIIPKLPANPTDDLMVALKEEKGISIMKAKLTIDTICIIIAFALKGPIGIGTIIATVIVGPLIDIINKLIIKVFTLNLSQ